MEIFKDNYKFTRKSNTHKLFNRIEHWADQGNKLIAKISLSKTIKKRYDNQIENNIRSINNLKTHKLNLKYQLDGYLYIEVRSKNYQKIIPFYKFNSWEDLKENLLKTFEDLRGIDDSKELQEDIDNMVEMINDDVVDLKLLLEASKVSFTKDSLTTQLQSYLLSIQEYMRSIKGMYEPAVGDKIVAKCKGVTSYRGEIVESIEGDTIVTDKRKIQKSNVRPVLSIFLNSPILCKFILAAHESIDVASGLYDTEEVKVIASGVVK